MLVLSRRLNEKIVFPSINVAVQVVSVKPGLIRLGIEAPPEITILREEVATRAPLDQTPMPPALKRSPAERLQGVTARLELLRRQIEAGQTGPAAETLDVIEKELDALQGKAENAAPKSSPRRRIPPLIRR